MKILISEENAQEIERILKKCNGSAKSFTFTKFFEISGIAESFEDILIDKLEIPKTLRSGAGGYAVSGGSVYSAYKYDRKTTSVYVNRGKNGWYLVDVKPSSLYAGQNAYEELTLTEEQDVYAIKQLRKNYTVKKVESGGLHE